MIPPSGTTSCVQLRARAPAVAPFMTLALALVVTSVAGAAGVPVHCSNRPNPGPRNRAIIFDDIVGKWGFNGQKVSDPCDFFVNQHTPVEMDISCDGRVMFTDPHGFEPSLYGNVTMEHGSLTIRWSVPGHPAHHEIVVGKPLAWASHMRPNQQEVTAFAGTYTQHYGNCSARYVGKMTMMMQD
jgi:hypothetical protein